MTSSKISFILLYFLALPVFLELPYLLDLWLVNVPPHVHIFTRIIILESLCETLGSPMITSLLATGKIKWYQIVVGSVMLLNIPISYALLKMGLPISIPLLVSLVLTALALILRLWFCKRLISLSIRKYICKVLMPLGAVLLLSPLLPTIVSINMNESFFRLLITALVSLISVGACVYFLGLSCNERCLVQDLVRHKLKRTV